jgi:hypothetical protein
MVERDLTEVEAYARTDLNFDGYETRAGASYRQNVTSISGFYTYFELEQEILPKLNEQSCLALRDNQIYVSVE